MRGGLEETGDDSDLLMTGRNQQSDLGTRTQTIKYERLNESIDGKQSCDKQDME